MLGRREKETEARADNIFKGGLEFVLTAEHRALSYRSITMGRER